MLRLLWDPSDAILDIKKNKSYFTVFLTLLLTALFLGLSTALFAWLKIPLNLALLTGISVAIGLIILSFYCGLLTQLIMKGLTGGGDFFSGFTSFVYSFFSASVGLLLVSAALVWSVALNNQVTTIFLIGIVTIISPILLGLSVAASLKCMKELFETNMITAVLGVVILKITVLIFVTLLLILFALFMQGNTALGFAGLTEIHIAG